LKAFFSNLLNRCPIHHQQSPFIISSGFNIFI
jgi:hypothetical protein